MSLLLGVCALLTFLNTSVDAKDAKRKYQGRKEDKKNSFFFPLRSLQSSFAIFASTLVFNPGQRGTKT